LLPLPQPFDSPLGFELAGVQPPAFLFLGTFFGAPLPRRTSLSLRFTRHNAALSQEFIEVIETILDFSDGL